MLDRCSVYYSSTPASFPTASSAPQQVVSGRASLIYVSCSFVIANGVTAPQDNRCYYLCGSSDANDVLFKFCPFSSSWLNSMCQVNFPIGGSGILFPDGIYVGKDANAPDSASSALDLTYSLSLFYTGGVNT